MGCTCTRVVSSLGKYTVYIHRMESIDQTFEKRKRKLDTTDGPPVHTSKKPKVSYNYIIHVHVLFVYMCVVVCIYKFCIYCNSLQIDYCTVAPL